MPFIVVASGRSEKLVWGVFQMQSKTTIEWYVESKIKQLYDYYKQV